MTSGPSSGDHQRPPQHDPQAAAGARAWLPASSSRGQSGGPPPALSPHSQGSPPPLAPHPGPKPFAFFVVLLLAVGLVVTGLHMLPLGSRPTPPSVDPGGVPAAASKPSRPQTSAGTTRTNLTANELYRLRVSGSCRTQVRTVSSRTGYTKQVDELIGCLEKLFRPLIDTAGGHFTDVRRTFYSRVTTSPCGRENDAYAFYCESDRTMYFSDRVYADARYERLSVADVVIHEYGHHVQAMLGLFRTAAELDEGRAIIVRREELQVYCWTYYVLASVRSFELTEDDRRYFLDSWSSTDDPEGHGSVRAQQYWGSRGLAGGNFGACDTWSVSPDLVR